MGKQSDFLSSPPSPTSGSATPLIESDSAISLDPTLAGPSTSNHSDLQPPPFDDDLPPLYDEVENLAVPDIVDPLVGTPYNPAGRISVQPFARDAATDTVYYLHNLFDWNVEYLEGTIVHLSKLPPRPFVHIVGTHSETRQKSNDDRTEQVQVVDFDLEIELTSLFYFDIRNPDEGAWRDLCSVGNLEKVHRGTIFPTRALGFGGSGGDGGAAENGEPTVNDWCRRFCDSGARLKNMTFERRIVGWDWDALQEKLERLVQDTNYRGHINVSFPVRNARVEFYSDCRINRWRLTKWIRVLFTLTLMFIVAWPWLFFRTKRWETVYVEWHLSRDEQDESGATVRKYATMSEYQWYNLWARAIQKAVLERKQGQMDHGDLERAQTVPEERTGFAGVVQAGVEAMGVVNRSFGWGGDNFKAPGSISGGIRLGGSSRRGHRR